MTKHIYFITLILKKIEMNKGYFFCFLNNKTPNLKLSLKMKLMVLLIAR